MYLMSKLASKKWQQERPIQLERSVPESNMTSQKHVQSLQKGHSKSIFKINIEINKKFNIFSENVIFQLILKKSIKKDQININKKSI